MSDRPTRRLSRELVEQAEYEGSAYRTKSGRKRWTEHVVWDEAAAGLGLRITSTGKRSYVVDYRTGGRRRRKSLGATDGLELDEARRLARELTGESGAPAPDPPAEPAIDRSEPPAALEPSPATVPGKRVDTVSDLADAYLEHLKIHTSSWFMQQRLMRSQIKPLLGRVRLADLTRQRATGFRTRLAAQHPSEARHLIALLKGMLTWAEERGLRQGGVLGGAAQEDEAISPEAAGSDTGLGEPEPPPETAQADSDETASRIEELEFDRARLERQLEEAHREQQQASRQDKSPRWIDQNRKVIKNLQASVAQLMQSLEESEAERRSLGEKLGRAEAAEKTLRQKVASLERAVTARSRRPASPTTRSAAGSTPIYSPTTRVSVRRSRTPRVWAFAAGVAAGGLLVALIWWPRSAPAREPLAGVSDTALPSAETAADLERAVTMVRDWAGAWSAQRVEQYLSYYAVDFAPPGGLSRLAWEQLRRDRILRPASIVVTIGPVTLTPLEPDRVQASFDQAYVAGSFRDRTRKLLELVWRDGGWKIVSEVAD